MRPSGYLGVAACVALALVIAIVFDSPTSVLLLVGLALIVLSVTYSLSRGSR